MRRPSFPRARAAVHVALAVACAAACGREAPSTVATRDSAGLRIVTNGATDTRYGGASAWRAAVELRIGADTADDYRFGRIGDVAVLSNGEIVVLDQGSSQLRIFAPDGRFQRAFGRDGKGPGEFSRFATNVLVGAGDSLWVPDPNARRMTVFAPDGSFGRVIAMPTLPQGKSWVRLDDGRLLARGYTVTRPPDGTFAFWDAMVRIAPDASTADTLFTFDHDKTDLGGPGKIRIALIVNNPSWTRLDDGRFVWSALDRDYVMVHDSTGRAVGRWSRTAWQSRPVSPAEKDALRELLRTKLKALGGSPDIADGANVEAPERFPAITGVRAGPDGTTWVQRMGAIALVDPMAINSSERSEYFGGPSWDVLDRHGRYVGTITLPERMRIFRMVGDVVYGAQRDDDGVEHVVRLKVAR